MYNKEVAESIASQQTEDGWTDDQIDKYAKMQQAIFDEAFPTGEESLTFSEMDEIVRRNIHKYLDTTREED